VSATPDHLDLILGQWRAERPDVDTSAMAVLGRLFRFAQLADAVLADELAERGLQPGWFDLLAALRRSGAPYELNPTQLMSATMLSSGGMTKRLDRLTDAGLVERSPDPADRRGVLVRLTPKGKQLVDDVLEAHLGNQARLLEPLDEADRRSLEQLLRTLLAGLDGPSPDRHRRETPAPPH
jgi:DNA-binding MarR family transcriptional regulator